MRASHFNRRSLGERLDWDSQHLWFPKENPVTKTQQQKIHNVILTNGLKNSHLKEAVIKRLTSHQSHQLYYEAYQTQLLQSALHI